MDINRQMYSSQGMWRYVNTQQLRFLQLSPQCKEFYQVPWLKVHNDDELCDGVSPQYKL
jgi:hypothetical protein